MSSTSYDLSVGGYGAVRVLKDGAKTIVKHIGNEIVVFDLKLGVAQIHHCGRKKATTAKAINRFLRLVDDHRFVRLKFLEGEHELVLEDAKRRQKKIIREPLKISLSGRQMSRFFTRYGYFTDPALRLGDDRIPF